MAVRLYIVVEGATEENYANSVLVPHLAVREVWTAVSPVVTKGRRGSHEAQGGGRTYKKWNDDLTTWIKQAGKHSDVWFTTMLDLYGLGEFTDEFPAYNTHRNCADRYERVRLLEDAWARDIGFHRFVPHLQLHEFEALLLTDVSVLKDVFIEQAAKVDALATEITKTGKKPELIDDGRETAPSKRIIKHVPQYREQKAVAGSQAAGGIGLSRLRAACPHFNEWLTRLESLGAASPDH